LSEMGAPNVKQATENANARMKGDDIAGELVAILTAPAKTAKAGVR
jgi:hypothetical protein